MGSVAAQATWYIKESTFTRVVNGAFYLEDFNDFTFGSPLDAVRPLGPRLARTASAGTRRRLKACGRSMAPCPYRGATIADDHSYGGAATAFGAIIGDTDINGELIAGTVTFPDEHR